MRDFLASLDSETDPCSHPEFRKQVQHVCSSYVGGVWETVPSEKLELTRIRGAISNVLFICGLPDDYKSNRETPNKVLLRICFNPDKENSLTDTIVFALLSERRMGPKLYGVFEEGRIEEFIESRPLSTEELPTPEIAAEIARLLSKIHRLNIPTNKQPDYLPKTLDRWINQLVKSVGRDYRFKTSERFHAFLPREISCDDLAEEIRCLKDAVKKSKSPVVFCHNDLQEGNILLPINRPKGSDDLGLVFIDFEYANFNYRGFDFANHFVEYTLCYDVDEAPFYTGFPERFPNHDQMMLFMRSYLETLRPDASKNDIDSEAEELIKETLPFIPCDHLFWSVWSYLQSVTSPITFGFLEYAQERLSSYMKTKHLLTHFEE